MTFYTLIMLPLLLLLLPLLFLFSKKKKAEEGNKRIPPSPPKLPILGNLHQLSELLHQSYCELSKKYGPVMLLHLGHLPTVVISSAEAAQEALKVHDLACCSRPLLAGSGRLSYNYLDVAFAPYGELWRKMRQLIVLELFSMKRVHSFRPLREAEVEMLINSISESASSATPINLTDKLFALTANITFKMSFGFDYRGTDFDRDRFHEVVHNAEAVAGSFSTGEFFPFYGWIIDRISGHHARTERVFYELDKFFQHVIDDHLKPGRKKDQDDMIDVLLRIEKEQAQVGEGAHFTKDNIKGVLLNLFLGGVDTSAITLNWAMAEFVRNPRVMKKLQEEVRNSVGKKGRVTEADINKLEYLKMVVKETFRLHPAAPLLIPRETLSHIKVNGYDIKPKTMIQVNAWAIGRDPKYWKDPEEFFPERFADGSPDFKGKDYEFLPFGAGRRMCVGMNLGTITVEFVLANLVYCFDWKLPDGMQKEDINMEEQAGVSLTVSKKTPLCLVPVKYLQ
ncbi:cytochrome P450, putative [Ricinus communis]|uniref:Cytochrome P450, putative n=2 Tax=Ricinus communis TaxID=3988 RepID=B9SVN7_RICCO|nr:cytochrome P450, putative [Ricinus communis]|eukprot:XP_002530056.1 cytochrome P450 71B10 [Ricinus communis]